MEPRTPKSAGPPVTSSQTAVGRSATAPSSARPGPNPTDPAQTQGHTESMPAKKKKHRGGRKRRNRRQSFAAPSESTVNDNEEPDRRPSLLDGPRPTPASGSFYRLKNDNRSNTSLESEALLDHREQLPFRSRRRSNSNSMFSSSRANVPQRSQKSRQSQPNIGSSPTKSRLNQVTKGVPEEDSDDHGDRTPLLGSSSRARPSTSRSGTGGFGSSFLDAHRRNSHPSPESRKRALKGYTDNSDDDFDVNNPPSVPGSPKLGSLDDVMIAEEFSRDHPHDTDDAIIDIDGDAPQRQPRSVPHSPKRSRTIHDLAEMDVCYPGDTGMSELGEEDFHRHQDSRRSPRRRRRRQWPDLSILDEWSREEKEERNAEQIRAKKMTEPVMVGGRLRNAKQAWHREEEEDPYRYTYFNENFDATIHSRTISELCQFGATFDDLFRPTPPELSDSSDSEDDMDMAIPSPGKEATVTAPELGRGRPSLASVQMEKSRSQDHSGSLTPNGKHQSVPPTPSKPKRFGPRPTFWLDVLSPTEAEMKILAKTFGIHQLTVEDILVQEPREKVELFQNYYFVNYRSFEQDKDSIDYMEPVNIYVIVYRDGILSFHFSMTPHPANVRRRIRQLNDYMSPSADWMSYAIIDDITDAYAPLVQQVEDEVDDIDDHILALHSISVKDEDKEKKEANKNLLGEKNDDNKSQRSAEMDEGGKMLRRIGECRKKVMSLYRLLGNKADVIKGFAKRCNEQWSVAPRSEIGLYLGDIQDHIVTMTGNLSHYENLLSRAHSNYLAQINIRTSERAEQTNDVLNKLTVLGTIVLPRIWGMNCWVPGQAYENDFTWFWGITGGLLAFGISCYKAEENHAHKSGIVNVHDVDIPESAELDDHEEYDIVDLDHDEEEIDADLSDLDEEVATGIKHTDKVGKKPLRQKFDKEQPAINKNADWDPDKLGHGWCGYAATLEKVNAKPKVYFGSATGFQKVSNGLTGIGHRGYMYLTLQDRCMPVKILDALNAGYKITHIGVLYKHDLPDTDHEPITRLVNKAQEAHTTFGHGGMSSKDKDYCMSHLVSFKLTDREYDGLCSHSALYDPNGHAGLDKTARAYQEEKLARKRKSDRERQVRYHDKHKDDPVFQARKRKWMDDGHAKERARGKYIPCADDNCDKSFTNSKDKDRHYNAVHLNLRYEC
ncbi:Metal ion transporter-like protein 1 [Elsinoe fawcettii]|nr:Metal ion transporter-like protein 1 [Elsinoe fawcettii]